MQQFRAEIVGEHDRPHVEVRVRAGQPGQGALCGVLLMRPDEAAEFVAVLDTYSEAVAHAYEHPLLDELLKP